MPETRYIREYTDGELSSEVPYEVSDEQLRKEELDHQFNEVHAVVGLLAYNNWGSVTSAQKDTVLKNILGWALWKDGWLV
uniref:Uncharacterized protein n=1 Tax=viral metagenome TaxID=1070528 RepID=A0A6M3K909_9ZZZZ